METKFGFEISLNGVNDTKKIYDEARKIGLMPDYSGSNLDALYDALTEIGEPACVKFTGVSGLAVDLTDYLGALRGMCEDAMIDNPLLEIIFV